MVACEQTPLPSGKIGQGAPSPIFPERRGGVGGLYTGSGAPDRLHCGDGERSTFNFTLNLANKKTRGTPPPRPLRQLGWWTMQKYRYFSGKDVETAPHYMVAEGAGESVDSRTKE